MRPGTTALDTESDAGGNPIARAAGSWADTAQVWALMRRVRRLGGTIQRSVVTRDGLSRASSDLTVRGLDRTRDAALIAALRARRAAVLEELDTAQFWDRPWDEPLTRTILATMADVAIKVFDAAGYDAIAHAAACDEVDIAWRAQDAGALWIALTEMVATVVPVPVEAIDQGLSAIDIASICEMASAS